MECEAVSSVIDSLYDVKYNPFKYGPYLASFYSSIVDVDENFLLAPIIIPLCSHPYYSEKLKNANVKSSLWSIFDERVKLHDLQERIDEFASLTKECIHYCLINEWLSVDEFNLSFQCVSANKKYWSLQKNSFNLGRVVSGHSITKLYAFLGVKPQ